MKRKILTVLGLLVVIGLLVGSYFVFGNYSDGYRTGYVMKISKKGVVFKTWEGQLNVGNMQMITPNAAGTPSNIWDFSVENADVIKEIETAVDHGKLVKLYYHEKYYQFSWKGDSKYFVYQVEEINAPPLRNVSPEPSKVKEVY